MDKILDDYPNSRDFDSEKKEVDIKPLIDELLCMYYSNNYTENQFSELIYKICRRSKKKNISVYNFYTEDFANMIKKITIEEVNSEKFIQILKLLYNLTISFYNEMLKPINSDGFIAYLSSLLSSSENNKIKYYILKYITSSIYEDDDSYISILSLVKLDTLNKILETALQSNDVKLEQELFYYIKAVATNIYIDKVKYPDLILWFIELLGDNIMKLQEKSYNYCLEILANMIENEQHASYLYKSNAYNLIFASRIAPCYAHNVLKLFNIIIDLVKIDEIPDEFALLLHTMLMNGSEIDKVLVTIRKIVESNCNISFLFSNDSLFVKSFLSNFDYASFKRKENIFFIIYYIIDRDIIKYTTTLVECGCLHFLLEFLNIPSIDEDLLKALIHTIKSIFDHGEYCDIVNEFLEQLNNANGCQRLGELLDESYISPETKETIETTLNYLDNLSNIH